MFKRFSLFALLIGALALFNGAPVHAKDSAAQTADRNTLVAIYARMDGAAKKKDLATVMSYIAPETRFYSGDGSALDRDQYERIQRVTWMPAALKIPVSTTRITKFQWRGPDAIIWTRSTMRMTGPNGSMMVYGESRDYWGKMAGGWKVRQVVTLSKRITVNGELFYDSKN